MTDKEFADVILIGLVLAAAALVELLKRLERRTYNRLNSKPPVYRIYSIERFDGTLVWFAEKLGTCGWLGRLRWSRNLESATSYLRGPWAHREGAATAVIIDFNYRQSRLSDKKTVDSTFTLAYKDGHPVIVEMQ